jgi:rhodanese-related sulfurtransferase
LSESLKTRLLTAAELVDEQRKGTLVLDVRPAEQFAALHIRGSIQISLLGYFAAWAAMLIEPAQKLILIAENAPSAQEARNRLSRVGLECVIGYSLADEAQWRNVGIELGRISTYHCAEVSPVLRRDPSVQLVDVRSRAEWLKGHLPGAISIPLLDLDTRARLMDRTKRNLVYCHEGYRATTAASILLRESNGNIGILIDGVEGWSASGLPLELPNTR